MDKIVIVTVHLECDAHQAFERFTVNRQLESWLVNLAEVEPRVGGKYELFWEPDDRENNSTIGCHVTALEPDRFVSFEWRSPRQFKHFANNADPLTHVVVFFIPSEGGTDVYLLHSGWRSMPEWEEARLWQERAWRVAFEELEKRLTDAHA
ncbi:MAG TPA: SRPBCC domain-containing protein [Anaerolineales bacterium]|nr:SRPBCC domain-containing protein [Anaerolineales bacterium]